MKKSIDLNKTVYELSREDENVPWIMRELGFTDIANPAMLNTVGRFMTIPKGAEMKKISLDVIKERLVSEGYEIIE